MTMRQARLGLFWLAVYAALVASTVWGLTRARERVLLRFGTPDAIAEWRRWAAETQRPAAPDQPVQRRAVKADEPPSLVLMRDHFGAILAVSLLVASLVSAFLLFVGWGMARGSRLGQTDQGGEPAAS